MKSLLKNIGSLRRALYRWRSRGGVYGQSDEGSIIDWLITEVNASECFIEFGFHPVEFNCATLAKRKFKGLLLDGDPHHVEDARRMLPASVQVKRRFLTLDNLEEEVRGAFPKPGVLSIDVDGNDYWFAEALIGMEPDILIVEYNASFGRRPITVPYDPAFNRIEKHASGWYHGASLSALTRLARKHGYGLHAVSEAGGNAFFTKVGKLDPDQAWAPSRLRDQWAGNTAADQWEAIKDMPFVTVADV